MAVYQVCWHRVRTEIGNQNSRTFPGLFKDYLHFFQESFFIDGNSPNTAYTQDFCPIQDRKHISLSSSLFLPDFSSACCLRTLLSFLPFPISALQGFTSGCIRFVLLESNRIEYYGGTTAEYGTALRFLLPILQFSWFLLRTASKKTISIIFKDILWLSRSFFSKFKDNSRTKCTFFRIPGVFQDQGHFQGLFKVCANPVTNNNVLTHFVYSCH